MSVNYCRGCGKDIQNSLVACPYCGAPQAVNSSAGIKNTSFLLVAIAYTLTLFFPLAGIALGLYLLFYRKNIQGIIVTVMSIAVIFTLALFNWVSLFR